MLLDDNPNPSERSRAVERLDEVRRPSNRRRFGRLGLAGGAVAAMVLAVALSLTIGQTRPLRRCVSFPGLQRFSRFRRGLPALR